MRNRFNLFLFCVVLYGVLSCQKQELDSSFAPLPSDKTVNSSKQLKFINELLDDNSFTAEYYFHRAKLNSEANRLRAGMRDIQAAIQLDSTKSQYHFMRATMLSKLNTPRDAIGSALTAEKMGYSGFELDLLLGKLHYQNQNPVQSLVHLRRARQIDQSNPEISYYFGAIYADVEDTAQAFNELYETIELNKNHLEAYVKAVQLSMKFQLGQKARSLVRQALNYCEPNEDLSFEIAQLLLRDNLVDSAAVWFDKILKASPDSWKANLGMAKYLIAKKLYVEAENYYVSALEYNPNIEGGYYQLGYIYEYYAKDMDKAIKYYKKAKRLNRGNEDIALALQRAEKKKLYLERGYRPRPIKTDSVNTVN